ncbi:MAG: Hint domain-containing protein [Pseudomonadota bacterium]
MARISELHYSNAYARSSGVSEFLEVSLSAGEDPADFSAAFYQANGQQGFAVALNDPGVTSTFDASTNETIYVISADVFPILLTDPDGGGANNYEAYALVNTDTGTVIDFYDIGGGTQNITAANGLAAGATSTNLAVLTGPEQATTSIQFNQPNPNDVAYESVDPGSSGVICFAAGTWLRCPEGLRQVEDLEEGDLVETVDNGPQPIRWLAHRSVEAKGDLAPIVITEGTYGAEHDLIVSPQHRVLIDDPNCQVLFGEDEYLVPAKYLLNGDSVYRKPGGTVTYFHVMFDRHEVLWSNGVKTESLFAGEQGLATLNAPMRAELLAIFPDLATCPPGLDDFARPVLKAYEARLLWQPGTA